MKKIFSIFAAILFAGSMMAAGAQHFKETIDLSSGVFTAASGDVPAFITWKAGNDKLTITQLKGTSSTNVNSSYISGPRVYKGHILSFQAEEGFTIDTVIFVCNDKYVGAGTGNVAGTALKSDGNVEKNTDAIDARLSGSKGATDSLLNVTGVSLFYLQNPSSSAQQLRLTSMEVRYTKAASSEPAITVGNVAFGTYVPGLSTAKELAVIGENLSGAITATLVDGSNFSISGELTAEGGTLSVALKNTADGDYADKIEFRVGETLLAESNVTAHVISTVGVGSKEKPFAVADVVKINNSLAGNYWVKGYILGGFSSSREIDNTYAAAIALVDVMDDAADTISVQLPSSSDVREALNVPAKHSQGWLVKVYGSLEAYSGGPGVKTPTDYEIIDDSPTALINTEAEEKTVKFFENGQLVIIKNGVKYNALGTVIR